MSPTRRGTVAATVARIGDTVDNGSIHVTTDCKMFGEWWAESGTESAEVL
jgi:hypothetical protein